MTAFLGFLDDYAKITKKSTDGVSGWFKIGLQFLAATACAVYLYVTMPELGKLYIPFYGYLNIGLFFIPLSLLVIIGSSNAVNLTDGLDGLASGCMIIVSLFYLMLLPTVGENLANSIVAYRNEHGPFKSVSDVLQVKGIGTETFQLISKFLTVGGLS